MSRKASPTTDQLLAAVIAKLPPTNEPWPVDRQLAWFKMMATAFGVVYGGDVLAMMSTPATESPAAPEPPKAQQSAPPPKPKITHKFILDMDAVVKRTDTKEPVTPDQVDSDILDLSNGAIDMRMITWGDGSQGINGCAVNFVVG